VQPVIGCDERINDNEAVSFGEIPETGFVDHIELCLTTAVQHQDHGYGLPNIGARDEDLILSIS
jgi:hypothetical protein